MVLGEHGGFGIVDVCSDQNRKALDVIIKCSKCCGCDKMFHMEKKEEGHITSVKYRKQDTQHELNVL